MRVPPFDMQIVEGHAGHFLLVDLQSSTYFYLIVDY